MSTQLRFTVFAIIQGSGVDGICTRQILLNLPLPLKAETRKASLNQCLYALQGEGKIVRSQENPPRWWTVGHLSDSQARVSYSPSTPYFLPTFQEDGEVHLP